MRSAPLFLLLGAALSGVACGKTYDFTTVEVGSDQASRTPKPKSNGQFIRAVYADVLGRAPESYNFEITYGPGQSYSFPVNEQTVLRDALDATADPTPLRDVLVAGIVDAAAADIPEKGDVKDPEAFIVEQFQRYLGRDPGVYELRVFAAEWKADPAVGPKTIVRALVGSREYQSQ